MNEQLKEKIKTIENKIQNTKQSLKAWANQISHYHKTLKALSQQLEAIKGEVDNNMKTSNKLNNSQNLKGKTK